MGKLRLIQAGVGGFGKGWVNILSKSDDFEVVAIVDPSDKALEEAAAVSNLAVNRQFKSLEQALDAVEADAVLTVTPPAVHLEHAKLAFARGLHLMTEKPIATDMPQACEMVKLAKQADRQLMVSQNYRYTPPTQTLRRLIQDDKPVGELGHLHIDFYIPADFSGTFRETMPHVLLVDMAIHHLDLIRSITGRNIERVYATTFHPGWSWYGHNPGLNMVMELEGGMQASYSGDWSGRGRNTSWNGDWRLQCADGSIHLEARLPDRISIARSSRGFKNDVVEQTLLYDEVKQPGQQATLARFAETIRTGNPAETSGADNLWSFGAVMAGVQSAETGVPVRVADLMG